MAQGMMMGKNKRAHGPREKIKNPRILFKRLVKELLGYHKWLVVLISILIILSAASGVLGSFFVGQMINAIEDMNATLVPGVTPDFQPIYNYIFLMLGLYAFSIVTSYTYLRTLVYVTQDTLKRLRDKLFTHMETLPLSYFDKRTTGEIMSVYTNDVETLRQLVSSSLPASISASITAITMVVLMFTLSWALSLLAFAILAINIFILRKISMKSSKYYIKQQRDLASVNGYIEEMTEGQKVIKVFNHEQKAMEEFNEINDKLEHSNFKANMYSAIMMPISNNLGYISYAISAMFGCYLIISGFGGLQVGGLIVFLNFNKNFSMQVQQITNQIAFVFQALAGGQRIFNLLDEKPEVDDGYITLVNVEKKEDGTLVEVPQRTGHWAWKNPHHEEGQNLTELRGDIRFFDVDFGYNDDKIVLHDISIYAKPGQKIAFVGATGAGKTTITNLINRFYDVQDGKIRYDGINITKIKKKDLRNSLGIVLQDTHLFSGTIRENIAYGKPDATMEEVEAAAKLANADGFINMLDKGYDTYITGDGGNLSQGQRQLLSIARAAIINPPVLILDEATSSIDTYTESLIQEGMDKLMHGRTTFAIAHRLSTVQNSDAIMVLELGHIIERGSHEDLIAQKGTYYQLYNGGLELE